MLSGASEIQTDLLMLERIDNFARCTGHDQNPNS